jgi:integrase/recombinase XerC
MRDYIEEYLFIRQAENASPNTLQAYQRDLERLERFVGGSQWAEHLSRTVVRGYLVWIHENGVSHVSMGRYLAAVKGFTIWLRSEGILQDDVCYGITSLRSPKLVKRLPDVPSQEEMATLLHGDFPTAFPERDRLLCELLYGAGLRVSEAANIRLGDLRPEQNAILIHGKGGRYGKAGRHRLAPLNRRSQKALDEYQTVRTRFLDSRGLAAEVLFFSVHNPYAAAGLPVQPINVRSIGRMLLFMTKVRLLKPMHPHLLRHACATHMLENGCPLDVIAHVLGHDNLDITAHYAQVSSRLMMKSYNAAHPHAAKVSPTAA